MAPIGSWRTKLRTINGFTEPMPRSLGMVLHAAPTCKKPFAGLPDYLFEQVMEYLAVASLALLSQVNTHAYMQSHTQLMAAWDCHPRNYVDRFCKMLDKLAARKDIEILRVGFGCPALPQEIAAASQAREDGRLPKGVGHFYDQLGKFELEWMASSVPGLGDVRGAVRIHSITEVFSDWKGVTWFEFDGGDTYAGVQPVDFFAAEQCVAFRGDKLYLHCIGESLWPLPLDFEQYVEIVLKTRGLPCWALLCDETRDTSEARECAAALAHLFPDVTDPRLKR
eukprot:NODE_932_length_1133_cov_212.978782_g645_i0.p1 GENE.NODE_932_length_1133_cov_212.978782_g645_i0~~NODE_932_length_1133_cov_212.978782_g645_i0.p1  ORF type:complete len:281 (+),score=48.44 NODE_932_length_1133_cov_212.978782_g645_i0:227-1069(+)